MCATHKWLSRRRKARVSLSVRRCAMIASTSFEGSAQLPGCKFSSRSADIVSRGRGFPHPLTRKEKVRVGRRSLLELAPTSSPFPTGTDTTGGVYQ